MHSHSWGEPSTSVVPMPFKIGHVVSLYRAVEGGHLTCYYRVSCEDGDFFH